MLRQLVRAKVDILPLVRLFGADDDTVYLQHVLTDEPVIVGGVSSVVLALGHEPEVGLGQPARGDRRGRAPRGGT